MLLSNAQQRARKGNLPFAITRDDIVIPEVCPVLDIPLSVGASVQHDGSPTLDRLVPSLGYVPGNVVVVSAKANRAKSDLSIEELEQVVDFYSRHLHPAKTIKRKRRA